MLWFKNNGARIYMKWRPNARTDFFWRILLKNFSDKFGRIQAKFLHTPNICLLLHLCANVPAPIDHLLSEISFSRTCNISKHWKSTKARTFWSKCIICSYFDKTFIQIIYKVCNHSDLCYLSLKILMISKTNIFSVQNFLRGNTGTYYIEIIEVRFFSVVDLGK